MSALQINHFSQKNPFIWNSRYNTITAQYTNSTGSTVDLAKARIMGRIATTGKLLPQVSTATDGSQVPMGLLAEDYSVANGATVNVTLCIQGDVDANMIGFGGSDTLATVISLTDSATNTVKIGTIGDILTRGGILPIASTEMNYADNS